MSQTGYLILAISIIVALLIVFIGSFIAYKRTPAPKGCEDMKLNPENCATCSHSECSFKSKKEEK